MENLMPALDLENREQQKAFDIVANTNTSLFITGKAGTGKTTFVKLIQEKVEKNFLVLAPTGIAAIAAGGQTIHSFFKFPMEVIGPHTKINVSFDIKKLLEKVDTIIIDEASMVRSDIVDGMDRFLRKAFCTNMPFGGMQIIFVGDLYQLPPVITSGSEEEKMLTDLYGKGTPFFYKANVLKRMNLPKIEFRKVYRQNDAEFVSLLNNMRIGAATAEDLELLNRNVRPIDSIDDFSVTLTAINLIAERINEKKLKAIDAEEFCYQGVVSGDFKKKDSPAPEYLRLKVGAQVIFCRNFNRCANGTIAKVVELDDDFIKVKLENGTEINVEKAIWASYKKVYNKETRSMESEEIGRYSQYPLKLAWAITVHKSQGMTFDRMHFDLTRGTFLPGQAYVAISRMRSLDGLTLSNPIMPHHITLNPEILAFSNSFNNVEMIDDELEIGKLVYKHLMKKDFDGAARVCLDSAIMKAQNNDYRNAALVAKRMFDVMLGDEHLLGYTKDVKLLKDCSTSCNFLNAVFCLYGERYSEAIGYADMILGRRICLEAMFVKARALFELGKYDDAYDVYYQIITLSDKTEEKKEIDKKLLLFEAMINEKIGNSNIAICKKLIELCHECLTAYLMLRKEMLAKGNSFEVNEDEEGNELILAFNDSRLKDKAFMRKLHKSDKDGKSFLKLKRWINKI